MKVSVKVANVETGFRARSLYPSYQKKGPSDTGNCWVLTTCGPHRVAGTLGMLETGFEDSCGKELRDRVQPTTSSYIIIPKAAGDTLYH
jgi:hypothetical protein